MSSPASPLTRTFLGLSDEAFKAVPVLQRAIVDAISAEIVAKRLTTGTVLTALACVAGEYLIETGDDSKKRFLEILEAYVSQGPEGGRRGPDTEPSLVRRRTKIDL